MHRFRVQGSGSRFHGSGFRVQDSGSRVVYSPVAKWPDDAARQRQVLPVESEAFCSALDTIAACWWALSVCFSKHAWGTMPCNAQTCADPVASHAEAIIICICACLHLWRLCKTGCKQHGCSVCALHVWCAHVALAETRACTMGAWPLRLATSSAV